MIQGKGNSYLFYIVVFTFILLLLNGCSPAPKATLGSVPTVLKLTSQQEAVTALKYEMPLLHHFDVGSNEAQLWALPDCASQKQQVWRIMQQLQEQNNTLQVLMHEQMIMEDSADDFYSLLVQFYGGAEEAKSAVSFYDARLGPVPYPVSRFAFPFDNLSQWLMASSNITDAQSAGLFLDRYQQLKTVIEFSRQQLSNAPAQSSLVMRLVYEALEYELGIDNTQWRSYRYFQHKLAQSRSINRSDYYFFLALLDDVIEADIRPALAQLQEEVMKARQTSITQGFLQADAQPLFYRDRVKFYTSAELSIDQIEMWFRSRLDQESKTLRASLDAKSGESLGRLIRAQFHSKDTLSESEISDLKRQFEPFFPNDSLRTPAMNTGSVPYGSGVFHTRIEGVSKIWVDSEVARELSASQMLALYIHEAMPGHATQADFVVGMNPENKWSAGFYSSFLEGWAHYTELWALGVVDDPGLKMALRQSKLRYLSAGLADIGLHQHQWSEGFAAQFIVDASGISNNEAIDVVESILIAPGRVMSYAYGADVIHSLYVRAETVLAERFSPSEFHQFILASGPVSLSYLKDIFELWLVDQNRDLEDA